MAFATYTTGPAWSTTARRTASAEEQGRLVNPSRSRRMRYVTTPSDTVPTIAVGDADSIAPNGGMGIILAAGERLWLAHDGAEPAVGAWYF